MLEQLDANEMHDINDINAPAAPITMRRATLIVD
jgi:hypothetical protein